MQTLIQMIKKSYMYFADSVHIKPIKLSSTATKYSLNVHCFVVKWDTVKSDWDLLNRAPGTSASIA